MAQKLVDIYFAKMMKELEEGDGISPNTHPVADFSYATSNRFLKEYGVAAAIPTTCRVREAFPQRRKKPRRLRSHPIYTGPDAEDVVESDDPSLQNIFYGNEQWPIIATT